MGPFPNGPPSFQKSLQAVGPGVAAMQYDPGAALLLAISD